MRRRATTRLGSTLRSAAWLAGAGALPAAALALRFAWRGRMVVEGTSMSPTLEPGDRVLAVPPWRLRPGLLVTVADPRQPELVMVKRLGRITGAGVEVLGDNPDHSTDSRQLGLLPSHLLRGRLALRYWPRWRAGKL